VSERTKKFCDLLHQLLLELVHSKGGVCGQRIDIEATEKDVKHPRSVPYYALFQQLGPAGTYFSSVAKLSKDQLTKLSVGQAETVAVVPTQLLSSSDLPTLNSLVSHRAKKVRPLESLPFANRLPYDPFASFAPTYATEAAHIEQHESLLAREAAGAFRKWEKHHWPTFRRLREAKVAARSRKSRSGRLERDSKAPKRPRENEDEGYDRVKRRKIEDEPSGTLEDESTLSLTFTAGSSTTVSETSNACLPSVGFVVDPCLLDEELLQEVNSLLGGRSAECEIDQLLDENAEALQTLRTLQDTRLRADARLGEETAELLLATAIDASLCSLINWQPRSIDEPQVPPLIPTPAGLSKLEKALPLSPVPGYKGILKPNSAALKDNATVRSGGTTAADVTSHSFMASQSPYTTTGATQQRYTARPTGYPPAATTYTSSPTASYQSLYATPGYGTPHGAAQSYGHYATAYGTNGHSYSATGYPGYASPGQGYSAYPGYSYGLGAASYSAAAYSPAQQAATRSSQPHTTVQAWPYAGQTPVAALPPHMRSSTSRPTAYGAPTSQPFVPWPKAQ